MMFLFPKINGPIYVKKFRWGINLEKKNSCTEVVEFELHLILESYSLRLLVITLSIIHVICRKLAANMRVYCTCM